MIDAKAERFRQAGSLLLAGEQVAHYREAGYLVVRGLITSAEAARVRARLVELARGEHEWPANHFQVLDPAQFQNENGSPVPIGVQRPASREAGFQEVADHPRLVRAMEQLLGGPVKRFTDQALIKHPGVSGESFYHQDSYYWRIDPERGANAWIALDEVDRAASALAIMPGSHRGWVLEEHEAYYDQPAFYNAHKGQAFTRWRIPRERVDFAREALLPMLPGDAAFFTNFTWHRAEPNRSGGHRCAYAIAYQREEE
jgi:ectoine hydroxylase-related dioxygenase (phytanoyl-CoA dioxygenase family)